MDITQVKATITRGKQAAADGSVLAQGVRDQAEQARTSAAATAHDSTHDEVEAGLKKLKEAMREASRVAELLGSGSDAASEYAAKL
ncbi:hypothetical protein [Plantactinospora sp. BB1]|uniref:hypothetical protein n=1 Tax=Plantactinospora sp. BB1 TaxID=2071627 RepID=UPI000D16E738|nr:hypothetical protein [Plantactinospora sp. BB1]AVT37281.1 hypothetical protein C6W10_13320 [Plantactinospora sp. BB1]